jgi:Insulinase (Peptidase family M16)
MNRRAQRAARAVALVIVAVASVTMLAQVPEWPRRNPPGPLQAPAVKFPPYEVRTLANGLQVITVLHHEQPSVTVRVIVKAGAAQDPANKPGVASLAASLLDQGTASRSAAEIADTIDTIGGALGVGASSDHTYINAIVMKDSFDLALDLVSEIGSGSNWSRRCGSATKIPTTSPTSSSTGSSTASTRMACPTTERRNPSGRSRVMIWFSSMRHISRPTTR